MLIILEGPDGAGKTTLAEEILKMYPWYRYIHCDPPKTKKPYLEYLELLQKVGPNTIIDRCFYSEMVYGPLHRGKSGVEQWQMFYLELLAQLRQSLVVFCTAGLGTLEARCYAKGDSKQVIETLGAIINGYNKVSELASLTSLNYNSDKVGPEFFNFSSFMDSRKTGHLRGTGNPDRPKLCLVGDKISGFSRMPDQGSERWTEDPWKFVRPFDRGQGSQFLLQCLLDAGYGVEDVYLTNSSFPQILTWEAELLAELEAVRPKHVVALGKRAAEKLDILDIKYTKMPDPRYWRRFQWRHLDMYVAQLRGLLWTGHN